MIKSVLVDFDSAWSVSEDNITEDYNSIVILKVDYMTNKFEGGYEQQINSEITDADTIPITIKYKAPGDFGNISLYYKPTNDLLFDGSIIWNGTGTINYPQTFRPAKIILFWKILYQGQISLNLNAFLAHLLLTILQYGIR